MDLLTRIMDLLPRPLLFFILTIMAWKGFDLLGPYSFKKEVGIILILLTAPLANYLKNSRPAAKPGNAGRKR